jgi:hypothetical protein
MSGDQNTGWNPRALLTDQNLHAAHAAFCNCAEAVGRERNCTREIDFDWRSINKTMGIGPP